MEIEINPTLDELGFMWLFFAFFNKFWLFFWQKHKNLSGYDSFLLFLQVIMSLETKIAKKFETTWSQTRVWLPWNWVLVENTIFLSNSQKILTFLWQKKISFSLTEKFTISLKMKDANTYVKHSRLKTW